ncbi:unnamed protein product [Leptidea sinapis]|uniref:Uncharacterized protein n=1 Tax=Leptidea sinapis TaxID=189913 RepID=A0A5E4PPD7_9NEOP|nr:unnamed protein product [Leptidea sinapis]
MNCNDKILDLVLSTNQARLINNNIIISSLINVNWRENLCTAKCVNEMYIFYQETNKVINDNVPIHTVNNSNNFPAWFDRKTVKPLKEKKKVRKKWRKFRNPRDKYEYDLLRKRCNKIIRNNYSEYLKLTENNICNNVKSFWKYVNDKKATKTWIAQISSEMIPKARMTPTSKLMIRINYLLRQEVTELQDRLDKVVSVLATLGNNVTEQPQCVPSAATVVHSANLKKNRKRRESYHSKACSKVQHLPPKPSHCPSTNKANAKVSQPAVHDSNVPAASCNDPDDDQWI